jgi:tight adherence protein C
MDQSFRLWNQRRKVYPEIAAALPEAIDLMALIMKAGLDFQVALKYYVDRGPKGPLHDELDLVQTEMQLGSSRVQALRSMVRRMPEPSLRETASTLIQGIELGASLSGLLRTQSQMLRRSRAYEAERRAAQAPLKLMFPLFVFIFPTIFIVLFGPIAITMFQGGAQ